MVFLGFLAAAGASVGLNLGVVLQALDARESSAEDALRVLLLARLARRIRWIAGSLLIVVGFGLQVLALAWAPFVVVQPMLASGLLLVLFFGVRILDETVGTREIAGALGITGGIALLAWGTPAGTETVSSQSGAISVVAVLSVTALAPFALRGRGRFNSATFLVVASALAFGACNIIAKFVSISLSDGLWLSALIWLMIILVIVIVGLISQMTALQRLPATVVVPVTLGVQTFLPIALEPLYLHERWGTSALGGVPLIAGLLLVLTGSVVLARTRAVSILAAP
jgi:drug/metabolite transporter (DMT)-like permease